MVSSSSNRALDNESVKSLSSERGSISTVARVGDDRVRLARSHVLRRRISRWFPVESFTRFFRLTFCIKRPTILISKSSPPKCVSLALAFVSKMVSRETSNVPPSMSCDISFRSLTFLRSTRWWSATHQTRYGPCILGRLVEICWRFRDCVLHLPGRERGERSTRCPKSTNLLCGAPILQKQNRSSTRRKPRQGFTRWPEKRKTRILRGLCPWDTQHIPTSGLPPFGALTFSRLAPPAFGASCLRGLSPLARTYSSTWTFLTRLHVWAHRFLCLRPFTSET